MNKKLKTHSDSIKNIKMLLEHLQALEILY